MSLNPFELKPIKFDACFEDWRKLAPASYDKNNVDPFTKTRVILMNGTEFEAVWNSHTFARNCNNSDLRRELALIRRSEQQQQKKIASLKPINENILETTIGYEQLAVELTAILSQRETNPIVKGALDFALLEDFDHLYRYANLLESDSGTCAEQLVGNYTEIMPGRPTIAEHRYPYDDVKGFIDSTRDNIVTKLNVGIITAAEQQTMNYYMNVGAFYTSDLGRKLYSEIAMIEEEHVTLYGGLKDPNASHLQCLLMHEYTECYLYYSVMNDETDPRIQAIWERCFEQEVAHLHKAAELLRIYEGKEWQAVIPGGVFPELLRFHSNKEYVRKIIAETASKTSRRNDYVELNELPSNYDFFRFQNFVNRSVKNVPSHAVVDQHIREYGEDYRYQDIPFPIDSLSSRIQDNTSFGREV